MIASISPRSTAPIRFGPSGSSLSYRTSPPHATMSSREKPITEKTMSVRRWTE